MSKINLIMIIDDDDVNNFVCEQVIRRAEVANEVVCYKTAQDALDYLREAMKEKDNSLPELIFLDINMPYMSGWDFLDKYKEITHESAGDIVLIMLSSSVYEEDIEKSKSYPEVTDYLTKPLTIDQLKKIRERHF